ncbi:cysteine proteinase [Neoconidiobolus thromboides FSU 785]|nr:cysteine proteinase [Neoconidiobolus thromboides FSU 785]
MRDGVNSIEDSSPDISDNSREFNSLIPEPEQEQVMLDEHFFDKNLPQSGYDVIQSAYTIWTIDNFSALPTKIGGPEVECGGLKWRALLFPNGNQGGIGPMSLFAEVIPPEDADDQWSICAQFLLIIANKEDNSVYTKHEAHHRFTKQEADWGYGKLFDKRALNTKMNGKSKPLMENDCLVIALYVRVVKDPTGYLWSNYNNYDSKKATGYVGLLNQGATCYMNSLLQSLYFTNYFRKAVFKIPTENDDPNNSVALALQRVFYQLQNSSISVGTNELTKSFGWDTMDSFMQHDVQEFNRVLQDNLEGKMKKTAAEGAIQRLFVGKMKSYITCTEVKYESSRTEDFYDIQLNVKGCKNVRESFENYVEVEVLEGENKYMAEGYGLQDAKKGVIFESFPPVLHLQLKRFDYDFMRDMMVKINDRYEFPDSIDLGDFLSEEADRSESWEYQLHGVLVHSGDLHGGHYFALLKPTPGGKWYKFDDDRVTFATDNEVFEESFGSDTGGMTLTPGMRPNHRLLKKFSNAYMLVYVRKSKLKEILSEVTIDDVPHHLLERIDKEKAAAIAATKKRTELGLQANFRVLTDEEIRSHHGFGILESPDSYNIPPSFYNLSFPKASSLNELIKYIAGTAVLQEGTFRLWSIVLRENQTFRVASLIDHVEELSVGKFKEKYFGEYSPGIIYIETSNFIIPRDPVFPDVENEQIILVMVKYYDHEEKNLSYVGKFYANKATPFSEIVACLNTYMNFPTDTPLDLFDEVKQNYVEPIPLDLTLANADITTGDIICFQKAIENKLSDNENGGILGYFENLSNQVVIAFKDKAVTSNVNQVDTKTDIILSLNRKLTYEEFVGILASKLKVDPLKLRLYTPNGARSLLSTPVSYAPQTLLENILRYNYMYNQPCIVYYELLEVTIVELESKRNVQVIYLGDSIKDETTFDLLVPKDGSMKEVLELLYEKLEEVNIKVENIQCYEADQARFAGFVEEDLLVSELSKHAVIYAETITPENSKTQESDVLVPVFHFSKEEIRTHGTPFLIKKSKDEPFEDFKVRLSNRLGVSEKEFSKYKLASVVGDSLYSLQSSYIESDEEWQGIEFNLEHQLGLDHLDKSSRFQRFGEKAIKIFN